MKYTYEELNKCINIEKKSYEEIGRYYGVTGAAIKKAAKRLGVPLEQRRAINANETFNAGNHKCETFICQKCGKECVKYASSNGKFCSHKCQQEYEYETYIKRWKNGEESGIVGKIGMSGYIRRFFMEKDNSSCEKCGCNDTNEFTGKSILQMHHVDGDPLNNSESNLQLLCPNCHAKTDNYGSRNKNGSHARTIYYGRAKKY